MPKPANLLDKNAINTIMFLEQEILILRQQLKEMDETLWEVADYIYTNVKKLPEKATPKAKKKVTANSKKTLR